VALEPLARLLTFRDAFLKEAVIRASTMGMTADDLTVGILA